MASRRDDVRRALLALVKTAFPLAEVDMARDQAVAPGPGGTFALADRDPGEPEVTLSPLTYTFNHAFGLNIAAPKGHADPVAWIDSTLVALGTAIEADRTLGGLCDWVEPTAPDTDDLTAEGGRSVSTAEIGIVATYSTPNPLH